jgi:hypothetical protein
VRHARFVAAARRDFLSEVIYENREESCLGLRFAAAVEAATARALASTTSGSPASESTRRVFVKDFPFSIVYRPTHDGIVVFAVAHHSRRSEYWRSRVQDR